MSNGNINTKSDITTDAGSEPKNSPDNLATTSPVPFESDKPVTTIKIVLDSIEPVEVGKLILVNSENVLGFTVEFTNPLTIGLIPVTAVSMSL